jgi:hypothetical protein
MFLFIGRGIIMFDELKCNISLVISVVEFLITSRSIDMISHECQVIVVPANLLFISNCSFALLVTSISCLFNVIAITIFYALII